MKISSFAAILTVIMLSQFGNLFAQAILAYSERYRPQFHFTPPTGWMGDPSGLIYEDGNYHLFYWGHAVSRDLVHWEHWPRALTNENGVGVMSGSAVMDWKNTSGFGLNGKPPMVAIYSGLHQTDRRQTQNLADSNDGGRTWTKYSGNPVIDIGSTEFRDPQVFWYEPDRRWIMVVALAAETKVRFYASPDLKHWTQLSDFGPAGATDGVWECPDMFPLPVNGNPKRTKWVLKVDVQPTGGQYFIGDFDGRNFHVDQGWLDQLKNCDWELGGIVFADFEGDNYGSWTTTGDAFGNGPAHGMLDHQNAVVGFRGRGLANSFHGGDDRQGTLASPAFVVAKPYIRFLIGGGNHPGTTCINLWVDGQMVRTQTGKDSEALRWANWDVREFMGRSARIQIVDRQTGEWGHINVDQITFSDQPAKLGQRRPAYWFDYGDDFYAARSWHGMPVSDNRRIWIAWMGNWLYARDIPTTPWKGLQSIPRELSLQTDSAGHLYLTQQPIHELEQLRRQSWQLPATQIGPGEFNLSRQGIRGSTLEIVAEFECQDATEFGLKVRMGTNEETVVGYDVAAQSVFVDRSRSGRVDFNSNFPARHAGPLATDNGRVRLHVFVDISSIEVFGGDGRTVISDQIFPDPVSEGLSIYARGGSVRLSDLKIWKLGSMNR